MNPALVRKPLKPDDLYQLLECVQNDGQKILVTIQCRRDASRLGKSEEGGTMERKVKKEASTGGGKLPLGSHQQQCNLY